MKGLFFPVFWFGGLALGIAGTSFLYHAVTQGTVTDLLIGLALFLPGLYLSGTVLARARIAYRAERVRGAQASSHSAPR